jgi:hypothetical protein
LGSCGKDIRVMIFVDYIAELGSKETMLAENMRDFEAD